MHDCGEPAPQDLPLDPPENPPITELEPFPAAAVDGGLNETEMMRWYRVRSGFIDPDTEIQTQ